MILLDSIFALVLIFGSVIAIDAMRDRTIATFYTLRSLYRCVWGF